MWGSDEELMSLCDCNISDPRYHEFLEDRENFATFKSFHICLQLIRDSIDNIKKSF